MSIFFPFDNKGLFKNFDNRNNKAFTLANSLLSRKIAKLQKLKKTLEEQDYKN